MYVVEMALYFIKKNLNLFCEFFKLFDSFSPGHFFVKLIFCMHFGRDPFPVFFSVHKSGTKPTSILYS